MEVNVIALTVSGLFFAGVIKGTTGLGYSSCALPFLVPALGIKMAISILIIPVLASNIQVVVTTGHLPETLRRFMLLYAAMIPGIAVGLFALNALDARVSSACLGLIIMTYALFAILRPPWKLTAFAERYLQIPVGVMNGFVTGLTGSQVMPLFPFIMSLELDANRLVQAVNVAVTLGTTILAIGLFAIGAATKVTIILSTIAVIPAIVGVSLGSHIRQFIPGQYFRLIVLSVLFVMGCGLVYTSVSETSINQGLTATPLRMEYM
jgi:uncharacterized protein